jgi:peptide-methionine (S)-S-oxide reductase
MGLRIDPSAFPRAAFDEVVRAPAETRTIVLGGGSFWCLDALFRQLAGMRSVRPGYAGGTQADASYAAVSSGRTRHAQVVELVYAPAQLALGTILRVFFALAHDPSARNKQGPDVGPQFRSVIFHTTPLQRRIALEYVAQLQHAGVFDALLKTEIEPLTSFFEAEPLHHDYAATHPDKQYVRMYSQPKLDKLKKLSAQWSK